MLSGFRLRRFGLRSGLCYDPAQHIDEKSREGQIRPGRVGGDVEEHDEALAAPARRHERRAIAEVRPDLVGEGGVRFGQHLARDGHLVGR